MMFRLQKQKTIIITLLALMVLVAACTTKTVEQNIAPLDQGTTEPQASSADMKTFTLTGGMFWFEMDGVRAPEIRVNVGDKVRIEFTSVDGFHDWVIDEFNAATERVNTGGSTSVEFVADKAGSYEYYCSVGPHRANGMVGTLIIE